jgi:hypothetical protein
MKMLIVWMLLGISLPAWAENDPEIDNPGQISAFLASPTVHDFHYPDPKNWKSFRKYIQIGTIMPNGACRMGQEPVGDGTQPFMQIEIAVDRLNCKSLILEGIPDEATWQRWKLTHKAISKNAEVETLSDPNRGRSITVKQTPASGVQVEYGPAPSGH